MRRTRDFSEHPLQDYENRDFLYQGIGKAKDIRSVADYALAGVKNLKDSVYRQQIRELSIKRVQELLEIFDKKEAEDRLEEEVSKIDQEKYGSKL